MADNTHSDVKRLPFERAIATRAFDERLTKLEATAQR